MIRADSTENSDNCEFGAADFESSSLPLETTEAPSPCFASACPCCTEAATNVTF